MKKLLNFFCFFELTFHFDFQSDSPKKISPVAEIEIQASQIIERLEEAVEKATEAVSILEQSDETNPEFKEGNLGLKGQSWKVSQGFLQSKSKSVPQILNLLEDLVVYEDGDESEEEEGPTVTSLTPLSNIAKLSLVVQSVASFANTLDRNHLHNLNNRVQNDTTRWITHLFRFVFNFFLRKLQMKEIVNILWDDMGK